MAEAVDIINKEKNIPKEDLIEAIEWAIKVAYKKDYWNKDEQVSVKIDLEKEDLEITVEKTLVKEVENPSLEISFEELWEDAEDFEEGDIIELDVTENIKEHDGDETFGRIASWAARQVIIQKMNESEKRKLYDLFKGKEGKIFPMKVQLIESGKVILDYYGNQVVLPKSEQVSRDRYHQGQRLFLYVSEVSEEEGEGPKVVLSRKPADLVTKLFESEVTELTDGTVVIENIVRQPWVKTKILVSTGFDEVDAAWTLIWPKGLRVRWVMEELNWEKIDIIPKTNNTEEMVAKTLTPAKVEKVEYSEEDNSAKAYILSSERAKALWKNGLNITQASMLLDMEINVIEVSENWDVVSSDIVEE